MDEFLSPNLYQPIINNQHCEALRNMPLIVYCILQAGLLYRLQPYWK